MDWARVSDSQLAAGDSGLLERLCIWVQMNELRGYYVVAYHSARSHQYVYEAWEGGKSV